MSLRATSDPAVSPRSATVGDVVTVSAKVENTAAGDATVMAAVEGLQEGALGKEVAYAFSFDPPAVAVRGRSRSRVEFRWRAELPEGKDAFTFRGTLVLRSAEGQLVARAPFDVYVRRVQ